MQFLYYQPIKIIDDTTNMIITVVINKLMDL